MSEVMNQNHKRADADGDQEGEGHALACGGEIGGGDQRAQPARGRRGAQGRRRRRPLQVHDERGG